MKTKPFHLFLAALLFFSCKTIAMETWKNYSNNFLKRPPTQYEKLLALKLKKTTCDAAMDGVTAVEGLRDILFGLKQVSTFLDKSAQKKREKNIMRFASAAVPTFAGVAVVFGKKKLCWVDLALLGSVGSFCWFVNKHLKKDLKELENIGESLGARQTTYDLRGVITKLQDSDVCLNEGNCECGHSLFSSYKTLAENCKLRLEDAFKSCQAIEKRTQRSMLESLKNPRSDD